MGGNSNAKILFHGTSVTDPNIIIDSHEGLDLRFNGTNGTLLGKGVYFHERANYCDRYAFNSGKNKIVVVAKVLLGKTITLEHKTDRCYPPLLPGSDRVRYDSVNGGDGRFVIFTNAKAYPAYLITYN